MRIFVLFLLDANDRIVAIGNPVLNRSVLKLYFSIISGETKSNLPVEHACTTVRLSGDKIDFGNFSYTISKEAVVTILNTGELPLVISDVTTSCGCTAVEYSKKPVLPGQNFTLKIKYTAERPGYFCKTVTIYCNAEGGPLRLNVSGQAR